MTSDKTPLKREKQHYKTVQSQLEIKEFRESFWRTCDKLHNNNPYRVAVFANIEKHMLLNGLGFFIDEARGTPNA